MRWKRNLILIVCFADKEIKMKNLVFLCFSLLFFIIEIKNRREKKTMLKVRNISDKNEKILKNRAHIQHKKGARI